MIENGCFIISAWIVGSIYILNWLVWRWNNPQNVISLLMMNFTRWNLSSDVTESYESSNGVTSNIVLVLSTHLPHLEVSRLVQVETWRSKMITSPWQWCAIQPPWDQHWDQNSFGTKRAHWCCRTGVLNGGSVRGSRQGVPGAPQQNEESFDFTLISFTRS